MTHLLRSQTLLGLLVAVGATVLVLWSVRVLGGPEAISLRFGMVAPLVVLPLHVTVSVTPLGEFVPWGVANGMLFGFEGGALLNWFAWMGAAVIQYRIGVRARREYVRVDLRAGLPAWLRRLPVEHPVFITCVRWFPLGGSIYNTAAGALGISPRRLFGYAALGYIPQALVIAAIGAGLLSLL